MTALARIASFEGRSSLRTWLLGIAKYKAHEWLRARGRLRLPADALAALGEIATRDLPGELAAADATARLVAATLAELPPHYRRALVEKYVRGRTLAEMARTQGQSFKAVESLVQRARGAFADGFTALLRASEGGQG